MGRPRKEKPNHGKVYEVKITIGKSFDGSLIRKSFYSSVSKADARAKAEQYKISRSVQEITGETPEPKHMTFEKWAYKWLETYKKGTVKEHTYNFTYRSNIEKYLIPFFGRALLTEIRQIDIQRYFNEVRTQDGEPLARSTLDKQKIILKSMFDAAIDNDLCYKNPVKGIKYQQTAEKCERKTYSREEADKVEQFAKSCGQYGVVIMLETGVRRSELLGLQWDDIDTDHRLIHIQRAVTQTKGKILTGPPKSVSSDRWIPISDDFTVWLKELPHTGAYVLGGDKPKSPYGYASAHSRFMDRASSELDVPALSPHELRHTFGTLLREAGVDIYTIQRVMGHSDISVTSSVYVHNDVEVLRRQMGLD
ncbi:MAG: site-specific integrase [Oscillospiraceae bacterium]|nr:site-specific integrase [Oscillospiraceae bacterium]